MFEQNSMNFYDDENDFSDVVCPRCSLSRSDFLRSGILGCSYCYEIFKKDIHSMLLQKQGTFNHIGKISSKHFSKIKIKERIEELEKEKEIAAREENFIAAEALKNQIEKLKGEL